jgi:hypothetical protein
MHNVLPNNGLVRQMIFTSYEQYSVLGVATLKSPIEIDVAPKIARLAFGAELER